MKDSKPRTDGGHENRGDEERPRGGQDNTGGKPPQGQGGQGPPGHQPQGKGQSPQGQPPQGQPPQGQPAQGQPPQGQPQQGQGQPQQRQPPQGQTQQPRGQAAGQPPQGRPPGGGQQGDSGFADKLTRRQMLIGGAGAAAAAGGAGYWFFLRGPSGAKGVVGDYYSAWENGSDQLLADLYHEDSSTGQQVDEEGPEVAFPGFMDPEDAAEYLSISVKSLYELSHYVDADEAAIMGYDEDEHDVQEFKRILVVYEGEIDHPDVDSPESQAAAQGAEQDEPDVEHHYDTERWWVALNDAGSWKLWD